MCFFIIIVKPIAFLTFLLPSMSWLQKLPNMHVIFNCEITFVARVTNGIPVDPSVDAAVVGLTGWIIFKASTVKLPTLLLLFTASLSLASRSFAVTGVLKSTSKETITLPLLWKI